ncbi:MAG: heme exporter protein CcmB [Rhodospirillales bacterium]|nr:heme exporter protein CcmB [Rhodospirillales bacterium]
MRNALIVARRELLSSFTSPLAYIFLCLFLALAAALTFYLGGFFARGQADLEAFFAFHPWLYLLLIPALSMRLWAEERKTGSFEFLMTLPIATAEAVAGKFLAAWIFAGIALLLTGPIWATVIWLGAPDNGAIAAAYLGSWLMAGAFLALGSLASALSRNQVVAFVLAAALGFLFLMSGLEVVQGLLRGFVPGEVAGFVAGLSLLTRFEPLSQGALLVSDLAYFALVIVSSLILTVLTVDMKRAS